MTQYDNEIDELTNLYADIGVDSLDVMEIQMEIERKFNISIPDGALSETSTIEEIINIVEKLTNERE